jgi:hypothetical protein
MQTGRIIERQDTEATAAAADDARIHRPAGASRVRRHNRVVREPARIEMRAAAHIGPVHHDGNGFVGSDLNLLSRMLDARRLKQTLADNDAELALITSSCEGYSQDHLFEVDQALTGADATGAFR